MSKSNNEQNPYLPCLVLGVIASFFAWSMFKDPHMSLGDITPITCIAITFLFIGSFQFRKAKSKTLPSNSAASTSTSSKMEENISDFILSANHGDFNKVKYYLECGVDINATYYNNTALGYASLGGKLEIVKFLVEKNLILIM